MFQFTNKKHIKNLEKKLNEKNIEIEKLKILLMKKDEEIKNLKNKIENNLNNDEKKYLENKKKLSFELEYYWCNTSKRNLCKNSFKYYFYDGSFMCEKCNRPILNRENKYHVSNTTVQFNISLPESVKQNNLYELFLQPLTKEYPGIKDYILFPKYNIADKKFTFSKKKIREKILYPTTIEPLNIVSKNIPIVKDYFENLKLVVAIDGYKLHYLDLNEKSSEMYKKIYQYIENE